MLCEAVLDEAPANVDHEDDLIVLIILVREEINTILVSAELVDGCAVQQEWTFHPTLRLVLVEGLGSHATPFNAEHNGRAASIERISRAEPA
jgi:hypothetical protein